MNGFTGFLITVLVSLWPIHWVEAKPLTAAQSAFVDEMINTHAYPKETVVEALQDADHDTAIIDAMTRPAEALPWYKYRKIFLTSRRANRGAQYWLAHERELERARSIYGIPAEIILAIIGVESGYGEHTGRHRVIDALNTLAFGYPRRADFFRDELEQFFLMTLEEDMDPAAPLGSYAGAMGMAQFIPSSFRRWAVDFDGDGQRDLWKSHSDVIGSIANYLAEHGWQPGEPVASPTSGETEALHELSGDGNEPSHSLSDLETRRIHVPQAELSDPKVAVIELEQPDGREYWLGYRNFYVITRYNHSSLYAMAVFQLSEAIRAQKLRSGEE